MNPRINALQQLEIDRKKVVVLMDPLYDDKMICTFADQHMAVYVKLRREELAAMADFINAQLERSE